VASTCDCGNKPSGLVVLGSVELGLVRLGWVRLG